MTDYDLPAGSELMHWSNTEAWTQHATCAQLGPGAADEFFFPDTTGPESKAAVPICNDCPVRRECLNYALRNRIRYGTWGGMTVNQRKQLRGGDAA